MLHKGKVIWGTLTSSFAEGGVGIFKVAKIICCFLCVFGVLFHKAAKVKQLPLSEERG